jgi:hypothetical protein
MSYPKNSGSKRKAASHYLMCDFRRYRVLMKEISVAHRYSSLKIIQSGMDNVTASIYDQPILDRAGREAPNCLFALLAMWFGFCRLLRNIAGAAINWGFIAGKTRTYLPWDSWQRFYVLEQPAAWFHDVLHADGTPYRQREMDLIRSLQVLFPHPSAEATSTANLLYSARAPMQQKVCPA